MHGHTAENLADAPTFSELYPRLTDVLGGKRAVIYNAAYAGRVLEQTFGRYGLEPVLALRACAMEQYARVEGEWSVESESYYPVKLPGGDGTPGGNARSLLKLLKDLAAVHEPEPTGGAGSRGDADIDESDFESIPF